MYPKIKRNIQISKVLASGGTAKVYYGHDLWQTGKNGKPKEVAVKELFESRARDAFVRDKFKNEANLYLTLKHKNIIRVSDFIVKSHTDYIVMEYFPGINFDEYVNTVTGNLVGENLLHIFSQILKAVAHAHHANVYHLDIKPSNIMIAKNSREVKVVDFGIATDKEEKIAKEKRRMGTPMFMSPEQVKTEPLSRTTDIYALGLTLYFAVTRSMPYSGNITLYELFDTIVNGSIPNIKNNYPGENPDALQKVIKRATAKNPADRFQTCEEFYHFLEKAITK
ncbi:MAG: serine/threonine-protein kinase [Bacteroidota bacterium]|nr:serine/threonine-protein kinase [Bacteroidota bacterium]